MKSATFLPRLLSISVAVIVALLLTEVAAQLLVEKVLKHGKLLEPDPVLGWRNMPGLSKDRRGPNGKLWHFNVNREGYRSNLSWDGHAAKRILILGDSFAFGDGVNIEDRFDSVIARNKPNWSILNLGVLGYGTDQELIAGRRFYSQLRRGDVLLLLTYGNDFYDIIRHSVAGRSKPWFEYKNGDLREHSPSIGWFEVLRDKTYLLAVLRAALARAPESYSSTELEESVQLFAAIVRSETKPLLDRGVFVVIAHHGDRWLSLKGESASHLADSVFKSLCFSNPSCVTLDKALLSASGEAFFNDGHWSENGNKIVAEALMNHIAGVDNHG